MDILDRQNLILTLKTLNFFNAMVLTNLDK